MDPKSSRDGDRIIDLESGTNPTIDLQVVSDDIGSGAGQAKQLFDRVLSGFIRTDGSIKGQEPGSSGNHFSPSVDRVFGGEEKVGLLEKKVGAKKPKKKGVKKPPRPPRPPKSPSLDVADPKLVREISESATLKQARIERMKALKKMKNAKATPSSGNLCALITTVVFCIVMIWQGVLSRASSSVVTFQGSPTSTVQFRGGLISVQFYRNFT